MKRLCLGIACVALIFTGYTAMDLILQGGDITISVKTNAAYNDEVSQTTVVDGKVAEEE